MKQILANSIIRYTIKILRIYYWNLLQGLNKKFLYTYKNIEECARCCRCGRNVHDFHAPDELWIEAIGKDEVWCYDCFCDKVEKRFHKKVRMKITNVIWYND